MSEDSPNAAEEAQVLPLVEPEVAVPPMEPDPNLDVTPVQTVQNAAPPPPPPPPPFVAASPPPNAQPNMKVRVDYETKSPPWPGQSARGTYQGATPSQSSFIAYLDKLLGNNSQGLEVEVIRRGPAQYAGCQLGVSRPIMNLKPMPFQDIKKAVLDLHGGGEYTLRIMTPNGTVAHATVFDMDPMRDPPKIPVNAPPAPTLSAEQAQRPPYGPHAGGFRPHGAPGFENISVESSEAIKDREAERKEVAKHSRMKAEYATKMLERKQREDDEAYEEKQEAKMRAPQEAVEGLRRELDAKFTALQATLAAKGKDNGGAETMALIVKSIEATSLASQKSSEQMMTVLASLIQAMATMNNKPQGNNEAVEAMKLVVDVNKNAMEALKSTNINTETPNKGYEELLKVLALKAVNGPDNRAKETFEMFERGMNLALTLRGQESEEEVFNPEDGFMGNIGNLLLHGAKNLMGSSTGGRLAAAVGEALGRGSQPQALTTPYSPPQALPAPVQEAVAVPPTSAPQKPAPNVVKLNAPYYDEVIDEESGQVVAPQSAPMNAAPAAQRESDSLSEHVTHALSIALDDIDVKRGIPDWVDYARDKWGLFIQQLAQAPDDGTRLGMLEARCDPQVVSELQARFQRPENVNFFFDGLRSLIAEEVGVNAA